MANELDTGISYRQAPSAIQALLNKLQKRPPQMGSMPVLGLNSRRELMEFTEWATKYPKPVLQTVWRGLKKGRVHYGTRSLDGRTWYPSFKKKHSWLPGRTELLSSKLDELIQFQDDPRPRNKLGEFSPQGEEGPDPNAMFRTYRIAPAQPGMAPDRSGERAGILGAGGLAVLGGAGGSFGGALGKKALEKIGSALKKAKRGK